MRIRGPLAVMAMVCSKWAERLPSAVTTVHLSLSVRVAGLPTVIIGYGFVIPPSCIAGFNDLTIGFATSIVGACVTYVVGLRLVLRDDRR